MSRLSAVAACFTALGVLAASLEPALGGKADFGSLPDAALGGPISSPNDAAGGKADPTMPSDRQDRERPEALATHELSLESARRAVDAFVAVRDRFTGDGIENYGSLEAFVAGTEAGRRLEAEIVAHGFSDITDWNLTIMAVGSAYSAMLYDYASDLRQQIEDVRGDRSLDEETRASLIAGLTALMPSRHNTAVLQALFDDPIYREKLKLLEEEE